MGRRLAGRVAVVTLAEAALARRLAAEGATVVVVGEDAEAAGELLRSVESDGAGRAAFFAGPPSGAGLDALVEFVVEAFRIAAPPADEGEGHQQHQRDG